MAWEEGARVITGELKDRYVDGVRQKWISTPTSICTRRTRCRGYTTAFSRDADESATGLPGTWTRSRGQTIVVDSFVDEGNVTADGWV